MLKAKVVRPQFDDSLDDHPAVKLTAVVASGAVSREFDLNLRVKMQGVTDSQAVILDLNDLALPSVAYDNLVLSTIGKNGSVIKWQSSNSAVITADGTLTRPSSTEEDAVVSMTATATKGSETNSKEIPVGVVAWTESEELEDAVSRINWDLIKGDNVNSQAITSKLELPATVGRGVKVEWTTTSQNIDINTGEVTRPSYTQGQVTLRLVAELSHGALGDLGSIVELPIFVIASMPMTDREVLNTAVSLLDASKFLGENESLSRITTNMKLPYRVDDKDASRAIVSWHLADSAHDDLVSHKNISLSEAAEWTLATVIRPTANDGNQRVSLKATITVGTGESKIQENKFFDIMILVEETGV